MIPYSFFYLSELGISRILGRNSKVGLRYLLHGLKFRVFHVLDWLPIKAREPSLPSYLTRKRKENGRSYAIMTAAVQVRI